LLIYRDTLVLTPPQNRQRFAELDSLRAFAVLLVVWHHSANINIGLDGYDGVLLFFVISGFLITSILLGARVAAAKCTAPWWAVLRAFYARRFLRIFPAYYAVLFLVVASGDAQVRAALPWHLSYLSNWYFCHRPEFLNHLWSLSVEEQFYILWPWLVILLPNAALPWAIGAMVLTGPLSRFVIAATGISDIAIWISTPAVLDALGIGCLLAYVWRKPAFADQVARIALIAGVLLVGFQEASHGLAMPKPIGSAIATFGWRLICMWLVHRAARGTKGLLGGALRMRLLIYLGTISYGIYLIHYFVMATVGRIEYQFHTRLPVPHHPGLAQFVFVSLVSIGAAGLSWTFFEGPLNSLKKYFPYVRRAHFNANQVEMPVP
jgi:peptidoglycan/LPS O-acetylase OafA/YrhL